MKLSQASLAAVAALSIESSYASFWTVQEKNSEFTRMAVENYLAPLREDGSVMPNPSLHFTLYKDCGAELRVIVPQTMGIESTFPGAISSKKTQVNNIVRFWSRDYPERGENHMNVLLNDNQDFPRFWIWLVSIEYDDILFKLRQPRVMNSPDQVEVGFSMLRFRRTWEQMAKNYGCTRENTFYVNRWGRQKYQIDQLKWQDQAHEYYEFQKQKQPVSKEYLRGN